MVAKFLKHTPTSSGIGPITKILSQYPRVKGLGVGAFGEFSTDLEELLELTARARALEYADAYAVPEDRAIGIGSSRPSFGTRAAAGP